MAGLYIHIPFCKQACRYCDFYFTVSLGQKDEIIKAINKEIVQRTVNSENTYLSTIYFGGGTPSVLNIYEIESLMNTIHSQFKIKNDSEITFEANPDNLNYEYLRSLKNLGINRLSIGIQSFSDKDLLLMRRSHTADQGIRAIENALKAGFRNINIDLIFGLPGMLESDLKKNLESASSFNIQHISAYHLTYEAGTVFDHWRKKGRLIPLNEEESIKQFVLLRSFLEAKGFEQYEISNFARNEYYSIHNSNYWKQVPYTGVGPSAHSYNGRFRRWNYSSNRKYLDGILNATKYYDEEELSEDNLFNEYIMTSLRTKWGIKLQDVKSRFGENKYNYLLQRIIKYLDAGLLLCESDICYLTESGILLSDNIISDLFH